MTEASVDSTRSCRRWFVFAMLCVSYLFVFSQRTGPGLISNQLQAQFHVSAAELGTVASIQYFLYMVLQIPVGMFGDKFGPERLFIAGVTLDGVGTVVFANAHSFPVLLVGRAVVGAGDALIWVNIVLIVGKWFAAKEFGSVLGLVGTSGNVGAVLATIPFAAWIAVVGWRSPFLILGILLVAIAVIAGYTVSGASWPLRRQKTVRQASVLRVERIPVLKTLAVVVRDRISWATFLCHFGVMGNYIGFTSLWAVPFFMDAYGISRAMAAQFILVGFVGAIFGGPVMGFVSDKTGERRRPYITIQALSTLAWLTFVAFAGHPPFVVSDLLMLVIGFGCGGSLLTFAAIRDVTPSQRAGATSGFANTGGFLSAVLLPVMFGAVIDRLNPHNATGTVALHAYQMAFLVAGMFSLVGVFGSWLLPRRVPKDLTVRQPDKEVFRDG